MIECILSVLLLLIWQVALVTTPDIHQGVVGVVSSLVVGAAMMGLLTGGSSEDRTDEPGDEEVRERLAFSIFVH